MSFLMPKPAKSTSSSQNVNNPLITSTYTPQMNSGVGANNMESALLTGQGDTAGAQAGYQNYLQMAGYAPAMRQMSQGVVGQGAASGLLRSGATDNALMTKGTELNNQFYNNYLQQLSGLSQQGTQAGSLVDNAGQTSQATSTAGSPGLLGTIASAAGGLASVFGAPIAATSIAGKILGR